MSAAAIFGLPVTPGEDPILCFKENDFPATVRITMAALDPTAKPVTDGMTNGDVPMRATLKMIRVNEPESDNDDDDDEDGALADLLNGDDDDDDEDEWDTDSDDEEVNGGPSDPKKSPKALKLKQFLREAKEAEDEDELEGAKNKGKGKARVDDEDDSDMHSDTELETQTLVLCTLDTSSHFQQPLDIVIPEHELGDVYFKVIGTHTVFLTGNIILPDEDEGRRMMAYDSDDSDEDDVDFPIGMDLDDLEDDEDDYDESDELDDLEDPRVMEVDSDDDKAPKLVPSKKAAASKKRPAQSSSDAEDEEELVAPAKASAKATLDSLLQKSLKPVDAEADGEQKLSKSQLKKQRKKLKDNQGKAVDVATAVVNDEDKGVKANVTSATFTDNKSPAEKNGKGDKKVTFAKTLVQGPSGSSQGSSKDADSSLAKAESKTSSAGTTRKIQGITIYDKKTGSGPQAKKGDRLSLRYIGKLEVDKRVFDSNTKGKPFSFKLGIGEVVKGMDIGAAGMAVGGERRITIPPQLAYGNKKTGDIPPNSTLVFDMKLLSIQ